MAVRAAQAPDPSGPVLRVACHPVVAGALFTITIVAMYTTPLFDWSLTSSRRATSRS